MQHVLIENEQLLAVLENFAAEFTDPEAMLFPSYYKLSKHTKAVLGELLGPTQKYGLGGLRGGGATYQEADAETLSARLLPSYISIVQCQARSAYALLSVQ